MLRIELTLYHDMVRYDMWHVMCDVAWLEVIEVIVWLSGSAKCRLLNMISLYPIIIKNMEKEGKKEYNELEEYNQ